MKALDFSFFLIDVFNHWYLGLSKIAAVLILQNVIENFPKKKTTLRAHPT